MVKNYLPNISITVPGSKVWFDCVGSVPESKGEKKNPQNNMFEEDEKEEVSYHDKMKFYEKLKHLSPQDVGKVV